MSDDPSPESVWGEGRHKTRRSVMSLMSSRLGSTLARLSVPLDRFVLRRSNGRFTALGPIGMPLLVLTTTGRKTGQSRRQPLTHARYGDRLVVVGTNFGQDHHPSWTANLLANPRADVTIGGMTCLRSQSSSTGQSSNGSFANSQISEPNTPLIPSAPPEKSESLPWNEGRNRPIRKAATMPDSLRASSPPWSDYYLSRIVNRNDETVMAAAVSGKVEFRVGEFIDDYGNDLQIGRYLKAGEKLAVR